MRHWRAGCPQTGKSGSEGGRWKSTDLVGRQLAGGLPYYMSAAGSPHQMERGKSAMVNAIGGLAIVLSARLIAGMIQTALGGG